MLRSQMDHIVGQILDQAPDTSDIIFTVGKPIQAEVHGELQDIKINPPLGRLVPFQVEAMAMAMMGRNLRLYKDQLQTGSCDLSYELPGRARFRVNVFGQKGSLAIVMRKLSMQVPTLEQLNLPEIFKEIAREKYGLILVTGGTGTGKSTSLAALIDRINSQFRKHIITLEDPIEFVHVHKKGVVNQRELGIDFDTFASGLRAALRQAPKVILVGEIRDRETMAIALEAAETGHLVLGTLHTSDAGQTINRIIGMFELSEERLIRARLVESLKYVISQRLMPKIGGGRVAAFEILRKNLRIRELILKGESEDKTFYNVISEGGTYGMVTFDQYLSNLFEQGVITEEIAMLNASDRSRLKQMIDKIKARRGEKITDIEGLELDLDYGRDF
ncbi:PilT/PilU family type 4a pilus ATPase [Desulfohalobiaceae bacterium Ax17]|jgi:twitching motility protein PilT|uniref:type IV pilus twitching motility protein PilT n=1 Tax=Desulfovulcanus ferrireducens TaxID=2831190 RepID=UPI00207B9C52|nr:PilT/PilU family type 4a pilus ATPase [Desulfovulcanus ferrireducens]MBT8764008.1 PilT/PilU family type 4a pilus ATPase [Desulfovulcanus ferrireducens]